MRTYVGRRLKAFVVVPTCLLSACGGGGSGGSDATSFAAAVGLTAVPIASSNPTPAPNPTTPAAVTPAAVSYPQYFVDFQNGNDNAAGTSKAAAWKHAPGDPEAAGVAAAYAPKPGDHIVFVEGSRYFGSIKAEWKGTADKPIVIEGEGTNHGATLDGAATLASLEPCPSQKACNGVAAWRSVHIAKFTEALHAEARLFVDGQVLMPAQWPDPKELFYSDETTEMATEVGTTLNSGKANVEIGRAHV